MINIKEVNGYDIKEKNKISYIYALIYIQKSVPKCIINSKTIGVYIKFEYEIRVKQEWLISSFLSGQWVFQNKYCSCI